MKVNMNINVHHIARTEGHGNIHIKVKDGKLVESQWEVVETPRFFEVMLKGMSYEMAHLLTARICGICSIGHALASLRATENAFGIDIPETAKKLRLLAKHGETLQSHFLHLFFLAAPDFFNVGSVIPLVSSNRDIVEMALRLKKCANDMCDGIAGRTTHPTSFCVGGMSKSPKKKDLEKIKTTLSDRISDAQKTVALFKTLTMPEFERETEFVSLKGEKNYPWIGGRLISTDGIIKDETDYLAMTNEYLVDFSTSKFAKLCRESIAVGALARINNNYEFLNPQAKQIAQELNLKPVNHNPYMNHIARLVECVHTINESIQMIDELLDMPLDNICAQYTIKSGQGISAVEVPRGILYHHYVINDSGKIEKANCVIPTTQNHGNIHHDMAELVKQEVKKGKTDTQITKLAEMLVRSYDPCISCSVH